MNDTTRLRRADASEYIKSRYGLSCKPSTLAKLATTGGGPSFEHFGRWPVYQLEELDRWVELRLTVSKRSTSVPSNRRCLSDAKSVQKLGGCND